MMAALPTGGEMQPRILVCDDDPIILRLLEVNLGLEGFAVETAIRGEDAVVRARETHPDLVILDVMMPGMTGHDVAGQLKGDPATEDIPIVFLSARTQEEDRARGRELGVAAYITKPFDPGELVDIVRRLATA
jgi:DNA-binding response OmpR family regulator